MTDRVLAGVSIQTQVCNYYINNMNIRTSTLWLSSCPCSIHQTCPVLLSHQLIAVSTRVGGHCPTSEVTRG